jgi:ribosome modulation factor
MGAGIQARRDGKAREHNPMHGHAWRRAWFGGFDYEDKRQAVKDREVGAPTIEQ